MIRVTDIRAKFGIKDTEYTGDSGKVWWTVGRVSARHGKVSDNAGMKCPKSVDFPKPNFAGSILVARSKLINHLTIFRIEP